jgi:fibronectin type 3 domain-containing protein
VLSGTGTGASYEVDLNWDAPASSPVPVTGYNVYRSGGSSGSLRLVNPSPVTTPIYVDNAVVSGTTYLYIVKSVDLSGKESSPSNQITMMIP